MILLVLPIFVFLFLSCASLKTEIPPRPFSEIVLSSDEVKTLLIEREKAFHGLKAFGNFEIEENEKGSHSFEGIVLFEKPYKFRLQGMMLGTVIFDFILKDEEFYISLPSERHLFRIKDDNFKYLSQIFTLIPPYPPFNKRGEGGLEEPLLFIEKESNSFIIYLGEYDGSPLKKVWLDKRHLLPIREEIYDAEGRKKLEVTFANFRQAEVGYNSYRDRWYPYRIDMIDLSKGYKLRIDFRKVIINPIFLNTDFDFPAK